MQIKKPRENTTYYYRVFAINSIGTSLHSNTASATTPILGAAGVTAGPASVTALQVKP